MPEQFRITGPGNIENVDVNYPSEGELFLIPAEYGAKQLAVRKGNEWVKFNFPTPPDDLQRDTGMNPNQFLMEQTRKAARALGYDWADLKEVTDTGAYTTAKGIVSKGVNDLNDFISTAQGSTAFGGASPQYTPNPTSEFYNPANPTVPDFSKVAGAGTSPATQTQPIYNPSTGQWTQGGQPTAAPPAVPQGQQTQNPAPQAPQTAGQPQVAPAQQPSATGQIDQTQLNNSLGLIYSQRPDLQALYNPDGTAKNTKDPRVAGIPSLTDWAKQYGSKEDTRLAGFGQATQPGETPEQTPGQKSPTSTPVAPDPKVIETMSTHGVTPADGTQDPIQYAMDTYNKVAGNLGLSALKTQTDDYNKQLLDLRNKKTDETIKINDNPWFTEGVRVRQVSKLDDKYAQKEANLLAYISISQGLYNTGLQQAQFLSNAAIGIYQDQVDFAQQQALNNQEQAQKMADARYTIAQGKPFFKYEGNEVAYSTTTGKPVSYEQYVAQGGSGSFEDIYEISSAETQASQTQVLNLMNQDPGAGIMPSDSLETATAKFKSGAIYRKETYIAPRSRNTAMVDLGNGQKALIDTDTGEVITGYGGTPDSDIKTLAYDKETIDTLSDINKSSAMDLAVGPNAFTRSTTGFTANLLTLGPVKELFNPNKSNFVGDVEKVISGLTLDSLINAKARGATFGALSEGELGVLANSATKIGSWRVKDSSGQVIAYNTTESNFKKEIDNITRFAKLDYILKGGNPEDVDVQVMPDGTYWVQNNDGTKTKL